MPVCGLGTFMNKNEAVFLDLLRNALDCGYRHFDTAHYYENHKFMGDAFAKIFAEGKYFKYLNKLFLIFTVQKKRSFHHH